MDQLALKRTQGWGGRRAGAGRPKTSDRVAHATRFRQRRSRPLHATLGTRTGQPSLRDRVFFPTLRRILGSSSGARFRVVQFSVQRTHLHLIVEAEDDRARARGMQRLASRMARAINRIAGARGSVFADRYWARPLRNRREVRHALRYVLLNWRRAGVDPCSSAAWFDGWRELWPAPTTAPVAAACTWLLAVGWRARGPLSLRDPPD